MKQCMSMDDKEMAYWLNIGGNLFAIRKKHNMSQLDLAMVLGISRASVANIECDRQRMTAYRLHQIAEILGEIK